MRVPSFNNFDNKDFVTFSQSDIQIFQPVNFFNFPMVVETVD